MPAHVLAELHAKARACERALAREPKPWNFAMLDPVPEPSPTKLDLEEALTESQSRLNFLRGKLKSQSDRVPEPLPPSTVEEEEESEEERITYSFSRLEKGKFLKSKHFLRWPPRKQENNEEEKVEQRTKKKEKKKKRKKAEQKAPRKRKKKEEAVEMKGGKRFGRMHVNQPDEGWALGPGDLKELYRWPNEVAVCLTEVHSAKFDFLNI